MNEEFLRILFDMLDQMTDEQRLSVFNHYCIGCGGTYKPCYCQRDD